MRIAPGQRLSDQEPALGTKYARELAQCLLLVGDLAQDADEVLADVEERRDPPQLLLRDLVRVLAKVRDRCLDRRHRMASLTKGERESLAARRPRLHRVGDHAEHVVARRQPLAVGAAARDAE